MPDPRRLYFTDSEEANALIAADPMALLVGFALDQQVPSSRRSWTAGLRERLGSLDADILAVPNLSRRFATNRRSTASRRKWLSGFTISPCICATTTTATRRACGRTQAREALRENIAALPGFGEMKVKALGSVLAKRFGVDAARDLVPPHPTLGDVDSPRGARSNTRPPSAPTRPSGQG